jgi:WD40 repeat protein
MSTTGEVEAELKGHTHWVMSVAFSQDGSRVVSGSGDKTVRIWNVTTGEVEAELKGHTDWVRSVAFSQDGSQVVSGSRRRNGPNLECDHGSFSINVRFTHHIARRQ